LPFLDLGDDFFEPPFPAQRFLQAQYLAVSLFVALEHLCLALKDFLAAAE
jgi:hypothetical protein